MKVTMYGILPPFKALSDYCNYLSNSVSKKINVEFISYKKLYPDFIYPDKFKRDDVSEPKETESFKIKKLITFYNPFSWINAALKCTGDIVHAQFWSPPTAVIYSVIFPILKLKNKKLILTIHNVKPHEKNLIYKFFENLIFRFPDTLIVHSEINKKTFLERYPNKKVEVISHGIFDFFQVENLTQKEAKKKLNLENKKIVLYFGIIREYKGIDILIKAFKKSNLRDTFLIIAGKPWVDWNEYGNLINELNLKDKIKIFVKFLPNAEVNILLRASDLVVLPYKYFDGQSGVGNVALAYDKPLLVTNTGALIELVKNKEAIADPNNVEDLSKKLTRIMADKKLLNSLSKDSKKLKKEFSWENIAEKTVNLYKSII